MGWWVFAILWASLPNVPTYGSQVVIVHTLNLHSAAGTAQQSWRTQKRNTHLFIKTMVLPCSPSNFWVTFSTSWKYFSAVFMSPICFDKMKQSIHVTMLDLHPHIQFPNVRWGHWRHTYVSGRVKLWWPVTNCHFSLKNKRQKPFRTEQDVNICPRVRKWVIKLYIKRQLKRQYNKKYCDISSKQINKPKLVIWRKNMR